LATTPTYIAVTEGVGKKLAADTYSENGQVVLDQKVILGEPYLGTFSVSTVSNVSTATTGAHVLQIMAGASLNIRIKHFCFRPSLEGTLVGDVMALYRLSSAGTGGGAITPSPYDPADTATATAMTLPSAKGTETALLVPGIMTYHPAVEQTDIYKWEWNQAPGGKPIIIPAGAANGVAWKAVVGHAGNAVIFHVEFIETSF
jgi:hypothetical protein